MGKRALVRADGFITDIVEAGSEFDVYTGPGSTLKWMDIPDEASNLWKMELGEWIPDFEYHDPELIRQVSYGEPGLQLSMIYNDIKNGTLDKTGEFYKHILNVKETCPKVQYQDVEVLDEMSGETHIESQKVLPDEPFPHDETMPCWLSPEELDDDTQKEFSIGKYAPEAANPEPDV
jgi:hypothetical protein